MGGGEERPGQDRTGRPGGWAWGAGPTGTWIRTLQAVHRYLLYLPVPAGGPPDTMRGTLAPVVYPACRLQHYKCTYPLAAVVSFTYLLLLPWRSTPAGMHAACRLSPCCGNGEGGEARGERGGRGRSDPESAKQSLETLGPEKCPGLDRSLILPMQALNNENDERHRRDVPQYLALCVYGVHGPAARAGMLSMFLRGLSFVVSFST